MVSSTQTLDIPELLENILVFASPRDLLQRQRVSKTWQAAIQSSPRIQEKLFYKVKPCKDMCDKKTLVENPFMDLLSKPVSEPHYRYFPLTIVNQASNGKASYERASWKQMFLTSPAVTTIGMIVFGMSDNGRQGVRSIECKTGVTFGQLADLQQNEISINADCYDIEFFWR